MYASDIYTAFAFFLVACMMHMQLYAGTILSLSYHLSVFIYVFIDVHRPLVVLAQLTSSYNIPTDSTSSWP